MQVLTTAATVERRITPLHNFQTVRDAVILPSSTIRLNNFATTAYYSSMGDWINYVDPTTLADLKQFVELCASGLGNLSENYTAFENMNNVLKTTTVKGSYFVYETVKVKEKLKDLSKQDMDNLVEKAYNMCFGYVAALCTKVGLGKAREELKCSKKGSNGDEAASQKQKILKENGGLIFITDSYINIEKVEVTVMTKNCKYFVVVVYYFVYFELFSNSFLNLPFFLVLSTESILLLQQLCLRIPTISLPCYLPCYV